MNHNEPAAAVRIRATITGEVQGVNSRAECRDEALRRGLSGWVRNRSDGAVEAVFEGPEESARRMLERCAQGPSVARIEEVAIRWEEPIRKDAGFEVCR